MKTKLLLIAGAMATFAAASPAQAANKVEKVGMVAEGIDLKQAIVRANGAGYTSYENSSHKYYLRLFAKAKGSNRIFKVEVHAPGKGIYFSHNSGRSEGWGVYKKSVDVNVSFGHTLWSLTPKKACTLNLNEQARKGMKKADVLKREWKTFAIAKIYMSAWVDSKGNNKKNKHSSADLKGVNIPYKVQVLCRAAL